MINNPQNTQVSQTAGSGVQPGQKDAQSGQSSQDNRYGAGGQNAPGQAQGQGQGRQVSSAAGRQSQGGQGARAQSGATLLPPVDIYEDETGFTLLADMPGVARDQLVVRVNGDSLLIEGNASVPAAGNMELVYGEVQTPNYRRSFTLSRELDPAKIEAKLNNGVLHLRIPKAEEARPRRIDVTVG
jgi:HSP20 family molecular chaperone IbpA